MSRYPRTLPLGDAAFTVEFGDRLDESLNRHVHALDAALNARPFPGLVEAVPTYRSLLVMYDPLAADEAAVRSALNRALEQLEETPAVEGRLVEIPVRYGDDDGPDLKDVAAHCGLSPSEVVRLHTEPVYRVAMMGFAPGFAYLFGLLPRLATPRLSTPRIRVEPGSVGIAGPQTGVYTLPTPGGWRIIGRTPAPLFDPKRDDPFALRPGDRVRFVETGMAADRRPPTVVNDLRAVVGGQSSAVASLEVVEGGFLTTVQDAGRLGWARCGVPSSGPMDPLALRAANILAGNPPDAAGLEITLAGPTLRASSACLIAVCGAEFDLRVGDLSAPTWHAVYVRVGSEIHFGERRSGARAYLAVSGGIDLARFLGSCATYLPGGLGGLEGRALRAGDRVPLGSLGRCPPGDSDLAVYAGKSWPRSARPRYSPHPTLRVVLGPQDDHFTPEGLAIFMESEYDVARSSDRMGCRLSGPVAAHRDKVEIVSDGVVAGSVQVPGDGQPIVMMADHQTTGGYPKIATVIQADLSLLAQCLPGDRVRFRAVSVAEAQAAQRSSVGGD